MRFTRINSRRVILFFFDLLLSVASIYFAFLLRFDGDIPDKGLEYLYNVIPFIIFFRAVTFIYFGFYSRFWEYSSLEDLLQIIKAVLVGSFLVLFFTFLYNRAISIPRPIIIIDIILLVTLLGGSRLGWRLWREGRKQKAQPRPSAHTRVLILGAGDTGAHLLKHLRRFSFNYFVSGFIDDDPRKQDHQLMGVKVLGTRKDIPHLIKAYGIKEILIAAVHISSESLSEIVEICSQHGVKYKMVASVVDLSTQEIHISKIRKIEINDLLGRDPVSLDLTSINNMIRGKRVMVTGAGGSIGSELCQQILEFGPASLIMLDRGENYLHDLNMGHTHGAFTCDTHYLFCSVTETRKMESIFSRHRPELVFHAAAHKHVPLMEKNVDEAVFNNIFGTKTTADLAEKFGVEKFVLVSTDKVVRPTSIMGRTKKAAEKYIQFISKNSKTQFMTVRFGNVLGSNGSVIPLFKKQIEMGGPVTVTHPDMTRYFMLIPEAVQLILQAAAQGTGREIFLLEMGQPVKIVDLANKMITLAGYQPGEDIEIKFIGIRPGEKLYEELVDDGEKVIPTFHKKIKLLKSQFLPAEDFSIKIERICERARKTDQNELKRMLTELTHQPSTTEKVTGVRK